MAMLFAILLLTCCYDANGNTRAATLRANTTGPATPVNDQYDFENRLVNRNGGQLTVVYDGDGQRVRKTVGGVTTHYLVDDLNPTGYAQVVEELTSAGGTPVVTRTYAWGHALLAQDQLLNTGTNFVWQASFYGSDAFGNLLARTGTTANNYLYQGEQFDHDLGPTTCVPVTPIRIGAASGRRTASRVSAAPRRRCTSTLSTTTTRSTAAIPAATSV